MRALLKITVGRVRWALREWGFWGAASMSLRRVWRVRKIDAMVHPFDVEHGVETSGLIGGGALAGGDAQSAFSTAYFGVPPSRFRAAVRRWRATDGVGGMGEYAFVDVGCGKGRAVLLASEMDFREVMGVELNEGLVEIAARNVELWKTGGRARCPVRVECLDAAKIELPDGPALVYLYNPFRAQVLRALLARIDAWAAGGGGSVDVLYLYPEEEAVFAEFPRFKLMWREGVRLTPEDVGVDEISGIEDPCSTYRWVG